MGIKSITNTDRLYWLGRYTERVYTTLQLFSNVFDKLIDQNGEDYASFCRSLEIPNVYSDKDDFIDNYAFSTEDPNSIFENLYRAYDNAIELRQEIGSMSLSYIQMAVYNMKKAQSSDAPVLHFQDVEDDILAFWGCIDDQIDDENTRNILKVGKRVERLDLYARMHRERLAVRREINRLAGRIDRTDLLYRRETIPNLKELIAADEVDYDAIVAEIEKIMEC